MIDGFFRQHFEAGSCFNRNTWFQQDSATAHTGGPSMHSLMQLGHYDQENLSPDLTK
jgi:hypothetical protein